MALALWRVVQRMRLSRNIRHALRGRISPGAALLEIGRRGSVALRSEFERLKNSSSRQGKPIQLRSEFAAMGSDELVAHFQTRLQPSFFPGFQLSWPTSAMLQREVFPAETEQLLETASAIANEHRWSLLGFGDLKFGEVIDWLRDPVSGVRWPVEYHSATATPRGGDVRVLWELNRLGHLITLGQAFSVTADERLANEFFEQVAGWKKQNPFGFGPNWSCAMEVSLRAMNLLPAFQLFRGSLTRGRLETMIQLFEQHGEYVYRHLEYSYLATSNHYLSDVVGLLWLGISFPELEAARQWTTFGLRETLREMEKQVLPDGAHYESSTGYHRFVLELFLFSFLLCKSNSIEIENHYWQRLRLMLEYTRGCLQPDNRVPLLGDTDSGQVMPIVHHSADEHHYLLGLASVLFNESTFKLDPRPPQELFWILGPEAVQKFEGFDTLSSTNVKSEAFVQTGVYVLKDQDLYLLFNASGAGLKGRGSHSHNDALSVVVSAGSSNFLIDPGTFVYTADYSQRHLFRSTGYHSTVEVDGEEQNTTEVSEPFRIGDEAQPRVVSWEFGDKRDFVVAEHYGYKRLAKGPITHRRRVSFDKRERYWLIEDSLTGSGRHEFKFIFHLAPGLETSKERESLIEVRDSRKGARLLIASLDLKDEPAFEGRSFSCGYGAKLRSVATCWTVRAQAPFSARWLLLPICPEDDEGDRRRLLANLSAPAIGTRQTESQI